MVAGHSTPHWRCVRGGRRMSSRSQLSVVALTRLPSERVQPQNTSLVDTPSQVVEQSENDPVRHLQVPLPERTQKASIQHVYQLNLCVTSSISNVIRGQQQDCWRFWTSIATIYAISWLPFLTLKRHFR